MNSQDIYNDRMRGFNDKMTEYTNNINKNNISDKLKSTIAALNERREIYLRQFSSDLSFQNRYRGEILSCNRHMEDDFNKGFPYGCLDDQCMFRWAQNKYFDKISVDVYNKWFLFAYPKCLEVNEDDWEHFTFFKRKNEHLYIK